MSKLIIDGKLIGTTAEKVEYTNGGMSGVANAKDALDNLQTRLANVEQNGGGSSSGGGEIDNADIALLADELLVAGGMSTESWLKNDYQYLTTSAGQTKIGNKFNESPRNGGAWFRAKLRVHAGDTLHFNGLGYSGYIPFVLTDMDGIVTHIQSSTGKSGEMAIEQDGYCCALAEKSSAMLWVTWTERRTLRNKRKVYMAYGDSISSDTVAPSDGGAYWPDNGNYVIANRPICYPRIVGMLLNADVYRYGKAGDNFGMTLGGIDSCPIDSDIISILIGANDKTQLTLGTGAVGVYLNAQGSIAGGSYTYTIPSSYMADLLNRKGLIVTGSGYKLKGVTVNNVSKYSNTDGVAITSTYSFKTAAENVDLGTLAQGDVIGIVIEGVSGANQSFNLGSIYQLGDVSEVMGVSDVDAGTEELKTTYFGRYRYFIEKVLARAKKDTVRMFCISPLDDLSSPSNSSGAVLENMRKGLKSLIAAMNDQRLVYVNGGELIMNKQSSDVWYDDLHPNENGQVVIANTLATIIKENLPS